MKRKKCEHKFDRHWVTVWVGNGYGQSLVSIDCRSCMARGVASLGYADEPPVDVQAAEIDQARRSGKPPLVTSAQESGMASRSRWYDPEHERSGWDAGWLARAIEEHDAIQLDVEPASGADVVEAGRRVGLTAEDVIAVFVANGRTLTEVAVEIVVGEAPEPGVRIDVSQLPPGSHDHVDCPCDHPPGEVGPCGGCNCADDDGTLAPHPTDGLFGRPDEQDWHVDGADGCDDDADPADCEPMSLTDDDVISDIDTARAIEAQEQRFRPPAGHTLDQMGSPAETADGEP